MKTHESRADTKTPLSMKKEEKNKVIDKIMLIIIAIIIILVILLLTLIDMHYNLKKSKYIPILIYILSITYMPIYLYKNPQDLGYKNKIPIIIGSILNGLIITLLTYLNFYFNIIKHLSIFFILVLTIIEFCLWIIVMLSLGNKRKILGIYFKYIFIKGKNKKYTNHEDMR